MEGSTIAAAFVAYYASNSMLVLTKLCGEWKAARTWLSWGQKFDHFLQKDNQTIKKKNKNEIGKEEDLTDWKVDHLL